MYPEQEDADLREIEVVYDLLFRNKRFVQDRDQADIIVLHRAKVVDDDKTYLFLTEGPGDSETFSNEKGSSVFARYSNNLVLAEELIEFLNSKGFYDADEGSLQIVPHIAKLLPIKEGSFLDGMLGLAYNRVNNDASVGDNDSRFKAYMTFLFANILGDETLATELVHEYIHELYVSFTTKDYAADNAQNMETREFMGDRVMWSSMTSYFTRRFGSRLTQNEITCLHREYCSKQIQASISSSLFLFKFARSKKRIDINTHENLFEAFVGTLAEVSFREKVKGIRDLEDNSVGFSGKLHEAFLNKVYDSFDFGLTDTKPASTELNENILALTGHKKHEVKSRKGAVYVLLSRDFASTVAETLRTVGFDGATEASESIARALRRKRTFAETDQTKACEAFYKELNASLQSIIPHEVINDLQNLKHATAEQVACVKEALSQHFATGFSFSLRVREVEKNWSDTYWTVDVSIEGKKTKAYSTEDMAGADMFGTLLACIHEKEQAEEILSAEEPFLQGQQEGANEFVLHEGVRLVPNPRASNSLVKRFIAANDCKLVVRLYGEEVEYTAHSLVSFQEPFKRFVACIEHGLETETYLARLRCLLGFDEPCEEPVASEVNAFVGNRLLLTYGNRILYSRVPGANEYKLSRMQEFYFSKAVKRELQAAVKAPVEFDEMLGLLGEKHAEALINLIFLNLVVKHEDSVEWAKEVNNICCKLDLASQETRPGAGPSKDNAGFKKSFFRTQGDGYVFKFGKHEESISFRYKNYALARTLFERKTYDFMLRTYGAYNISLLMNSRFKHDPSFTKLARLLQASGREGDNSRSSKEAGSFLISLVELRGRKAYTLRLGLNQLFTFASLEEAYLCLENNENLA